MALPRGTTRLLTFPYFLDLIAVVITVAVLLTLSFPAVTPPGTVMIYIAGVVALLQSVLHAAIVVFERDTGDFQLCSLKYPVLVYSSSVLVVIVYFVSIFLCINGIISTGDAAFTVAMLLCIANTIVYTVKFISYFRNWMQEERMARTFEFAPSNNYGSS